MSDEPEKPTAARILISEDEAIIAEDIAETLRVLGHEVVGMAANGEEAIRAAEKTKPDLILMDIGLAGEIDGIEAARQIRFRMDIPVVYCTGYVEKDVPERAKKTEPYGYMGKPVGLSELRSTVELALYKHEADKRVRESEERLRSTLDTLHDVLFVVNQEGIVADYHQPPDLRKLCMPSEEFIGRHYKDVLPQDVSRLLSNEVIPVLQEACNHSLPGTLQRIFHVLADLPERVTCCN